MTNADFYAHARQYRNFDTETSLPNERYLDKRINDGVFYPRVVPHVFRVRVCRSELTAEVGGVGDIEGIHFLYDRVVVVSTHAIHEQVALDLA